MTTKYILSLALQYLKGFHHNLLLAQLNGEDVSICLEQNIKEIRQLEKLISLYEEIEI